jgi:iron complex transport system substrate-binding protein
MRRLPVLLAAATAAVLALSACASGGAGSTSSDGASAGGKFPATIATNFGNVTVKEAPKRVVALGWGDAEAALALGVQPVGASDWLGFGGEGVGPWAKGAYDKAPEIIGTLEPEYEKIAALKPDLILDVKGSGDAKRYAKLKSIAPTIGIPKDGLNYLTPSDEQLTMIGEALGVPDKATALLEDVKKKTQEVADAHPAWKGKTATVAAYTSDGWGAYVQGDTRLAFLESLGFVQSPKIADLKPNGFSVSISSEQLDLLDADLLVAFPIFIEASKITDQPLWSQIPAVKSGHAIVLDDKDISNAFSLGSVQAQEYLLKNFVPEIEKAAGA